MYLPVLLLVVVFLFNRRLRVNLTLPGFEGSGILGFAASVIASPLDLIFMTAMVICIIKFSEEGYKIKYILYQNFLTTPFNTLFSKMMPNF